MKNLYQLNIQDKVYERVTHTLHFFKDDKFNQLVLHEDYMPIAYDNLVEIMSNLSSSITHSTYKRMLKYIKSKETFRKEL